MWNVNKHNKKLLANQLTEKAKLCADVSQGDLKLGYEDRM